jgi:hypothetical protein
VRPHLHENAPRRRVDLMRNPSWPRAAREATTAVAIWMVYLFLMPVSVSSGVVLTICLVWAMGTVLLYGVQFVIDRTGYPRT